jgi:ParB-like nuclease domain
MRSGLEVVDAPVGELRENPRNPRQITPARLQALARSIEHDPAMLQARPLIALPDGTVIAGNMRLRAARVLGWETVPTVYADLDEERARLWLLRDNNPYGDWEEDDVAVLLAELQAGGSDLELTGFDPGELDRLLAELTAAEAPVDDDTRLALAQTTLGPPRHTVGEGEVWRLGGRHTLIVAGVYDGHPAWSKLLRGHDLFVPYPTPMLPLTERAAETRLLLVQPNGYLAGHLLDRFEDHFGEAELQQLAATP